MDIFAFRVFDLRDHFPRPYRTIFEALSALFSDRAYMPDDSGEIVAYGNEGAEINVPRALFTITQIDGNVELDRKRPLSVITMEIAHFLGIVDDALIGLGLHQPLDSESLGDMEVNLDAQNFDD